jgi:hypothetical protein
MLLQEHFFRRALTDDTDAANANGYVRVNHTTGECTWNGTVYPVTFSRSMARTLRELWPLEKAATKKDGTNPVCSLAPYMFQGVVNSRKAWVGEFVNSTPDPDASSVVHSKRGRDPAVKYTLDIPYYTRMCASRCVLAPTDVYPWSYRLFEAIMCGCIPVLKNATDGMDRYAQAHGFHVYFAYDDAGHPVDASTHVWRRDWVDANLAIMEAHHHLQATMPADGE